MQCVNPVRIQLKSKKFIGYTHERYPDGLSVPCGKCLLCRIQKRKEWSIRMLHEMEAHDDSSFVTLTYSDHHLPDYNSVRKDHLQLFFKRLRKNLNERRIKYFACGEYGSISERPHYHAIIFGLSLRECDKSLVKSAWPYCDWSVPSIAKKAFGLVEPDSIRYVAQYIDKKFTGEKAIEEYDNKQRNPVFRICSLGLGSNYCDRFGSQFKESGYITVNGVKHSIPRYYLKRLGLDSSDIASIKAFEKECDVSHKLTGYDMCYDDVYKFLKVDEILEFEETIRNAKQQNQATILKKMSMYDSKL